ncbi:uncharacterized protein LOC119588307 [Penaeus monodon]|uniref:uncharacterized protein LOC119588307 n=1 Tax=Penaeus monodon TaxID=6687 RepID=UPI0018A767F3|nr:uncharacterized protein LOC119588307 [Penaeus monodon]
MQGKFLLLVTASVGVLCLIATLLWISEDPFDAQSTPVLWRMNKLNKVQREILDYIDRLYCNAFDVLPSGGFCVSDTKAFNGGNFHWDGKLCRALEDLFGRATVADFGAGLGHYGQCFLRSNESFVASEDRIEMAKMAAKFEQEMAGANLTGRGQVVRSWKGWDAAANVSRLSHGRIRRLNLARRADVGERFDWVLSLEVGEHIPRQSEGVFLDNLVRHACTGIVLSWAVPGQDGHHHVNNRENDYIKASMTKRGLVVDAEAERKLREAATLFWFKDTLMVFKFPAKRCCAHSKAVICAFELGGNLSSVTPITEQ